MQDEIRCFKERILSSIREAETQRMLDRVKCLEDMLAVYEDNYQSDFDLQTELEQKRADLRSKTVQL